MITRKINPQTENATFDATLLGITDPSGSQDNAAYSLLQELPVQPVETNHFHLLAPWK